MQNQRNESESESEEGEIEDEESDFENHDTSEKDGRYKPVTTSPEDELNLHTDGEMNPGENQINNKTTENKKIRRYNRESRQPKRYGGLPTQQIFGYNVEELKLLQVSPRNGTAERSRRNQNEASRLHSRKDPITGNVEAVTEREEK